MSIWKCDILTVIPGCFSRCLPSIKRRAVISISTSFTSWFLFLRDLSLSHRTQTEHRLHGESMGSGLLARWFTASRTFEDEGYSVTWLTEVEVAPRTCNLKSIIDHDKIPTSSRSSEKFESPKVVCCQWLWRGELAGCNCIKLAVTRPCINHSCGSRRLVWCLERVGISLRHSIHRCLGFLKRSLCSTLLVLA
ncbi:hypothetical protein ALC62_07264 [Cyphomyrmex costatus]|uniref:Uncharacterized protein n=1 Tax=Cyphomyrmex costatus TaxID=456900 RepID=A0A195CMK7_9HYME|nr:hypothetical protein ALC62_07264 [Cyphomyrmex costatus]